MTLLIGTFANKSSEWISRKHIVASHVKRDSKQSIGISKLKRLGDLAARMRANDVVLCLDSTRKLGEVDEFRKGSGGDVEDANHAGACHCLPSYG